MLEDALDIKVERGKATALCGDKHLNILGVVHGGFIATLLDVAMGSLINERAVTVSLNIDYIEPAFRGEIVAEGKITRYGQDLVFTEGTAKQRDRIVARASGIYFLLKSRPLVSD
ncbi:MAG: PaaI family thioesterase [Nitrososphaeria archaeon]